MAITSSIIASLLITSFAAIFLIILVAAIKYLTQYVQNSVQRLDEQFVDGQCDYAFSDEIDLTILPDTEELSEMVERSKKESEQLWLDRLMESADMLKYEVKTIGKNAETIILESRK
jgi:hypothetical protein